MTVYRPSARVELRLRVEEFGDTEALERRLGPAEERTAYSPPLNPVLLSPGRRDRVEAQLEQNQAALAQLERRRRQSSIASGDAVLERARLENERLRLQQQIGPEAGTAAPRPRSVGGAADALSAIGNIEPISVQIERNGQASADTCTITLDYLDAPFDPRVLRSAGVEVTLGVVPAEDFAAGTERGERRADGSLVSIVERAADGNFRGATRFVGFVDDWDVEFSDSGDQVVLECRDMSAPLRDLKLNPGESIDLSLPLDQGVKQFLDTVSPATAGVTVRFAGEGTAPIPHDSSPVRKRARRGRRSRRVRRGDQNMTLWDHLTDVCRSAGFVPIVREFEVVIAEARTLFSAETARRMIYGQNIEKLGFSRRMQGTKVPTIEVRAYDSDLGRTRWARHPVRSGERASGVFGVDNPPKPLRANEVPPSGANPTEAIRVVNVSGINAPATLERIARNAFEQIGRQEIEGTLSTFDVHSYDRPLDEADLLTANAGDPVEVLIIAAAPPELAEDGPNTSLANLEALTRARREEYLVGIGWSREVARRFAVLQQATAFQTVFRVQDVRLSWDYEEGLKILIGFINYITVREDA